MDNDRPFGFDPDDIDRVIREAGDQFRQLQDQFVRFLGQPGGSAPHRAPEPETTGSAGDGVWAVYSVDAAGLARVEQVYRTELDALRAHKNNTDPTRSVRFLPYGVSVGVLDATIVDGEPDA
ncbi:hypothetical protein [Rhodococcus phenolicus]|uniref:hypothetical protein n=1 Tax=Rhodococcus phenolicus TaxID=263849 RepID=UPI00083307A1|nr:hypothetical protein [Rhodococcus phenolicus]